MTKFKPAHPSASSASNQTPPPEFGPSVPTADLARVQVTHIPEPTGPLPTKADLEAAGIRIAVAPLWERAGWDTASAAYFGWLIAQRGWPLINDDLYMRTDAHRNSAAKSLLKSNYTHLFMLDVDHIHVQADTVERHARWLLQDPSRLVIGGMHFRRGAPYWPCTFMRGADGKDHPLIEWPRGLLAVSTIGHGTLLVSREVFGKIKFPWWRYEYFDHPDAPQISDDMPFCRQCNQAGITLWCDTTATSPHLIDHAIDERDYRRHLQQFGPTATSPSAIHTVADEGYVQQTIVADETDDAELTEVGHS